MTSTLTRLPSFDKLGHLLKNAMNLPFSPGTKNITMVNHKGNIVEVFFIRPLALNPKFSIFLLTIRYHRGVIFHLRSICWGVRATVLDFDCSSLGHMCLFYLINIMNMANWNLFVSHQTVLSSQIFLNATTIQKLCSMMIKLSPG